jgi:death-on-curing protein
LPSEPVWLDAADIVELNRLVVGETGEPFELRDEGLLESALGKPRNYWNYDGQRDVVALAVTLLFGIARNHPFQQGNKRTAFEAAVIFIEANGYVFDAPDTTDIAEAITDVISHRTTEAAFEAMIRPFVIPADA